MMQSERAVPWTDLTETERTQFAEQCVTDAADPQAEWEAQPVGAQWRFYAACLDARIAEAPDGVELAVLPLAIDPSHRSQHIRYSASRGLCVQRKGRFVEKLRGGKRVGWERRGEDVLVGNSLPTDLAEMLVVPEGV
jgi:hypothetical protein